MVKTRYWTLMVRSAATPRVSNHEAMMIPPKRIIMLKGVAKDVP